MHALSLATSILETIRTEAAADGARPVRVGVRVGAVSGVDPEALAFGFEALVSGSDLDGLAIELEPVPHVRRCVGCGEEREADDLLPTCPACGDLLGDLVSGDELEIAWLEVEDE